jgi:hypothetical protein
MKNSTYSESQALDDALPNGLDEPGKYEAWRDEVRQWAQNMHDDAARITGPDVPADVTNSANDVASDAAAIADLADKAWGPAPNRTAPLPDNRLPPDNPPPDDNAPPWMRDYNTVSTHYDLALDILDNACPT